MSIDRPLAEKTAFVTGASAGIGEATAEALAARGADVAIVARRESKLESVAERIEAETDSTVLVRSADVSDRDAVRDAVERTVDAFGQLDVLVNNAGIATGSDTTVETMPAEQYRTVMGANVDGMFFVTQAAIPHLRETSGIAVFVASFAGQYPRPGAPIYAATKWWTRGFAHSLAGSLGTDEIGVTVINPSEVRTEFGKEYRDRISEERYEPNEVTEPDAIADAVAFAAQQEPPNVVSELDLYRRDKFSTF
ncbi:SDR family oxidoreductase [Natrinema salaciae]|uniref:NADP-dependent 3-hydroxy acid dehydrogenase YdfG n=1 Tax=Natrinema salaciae TaxID=1186196 RepID=A0A1H9NQ65_9EURY|nr:SDR family oxidoreductase [Natrinema salaciae]SER38174.1 NADP-dependent 3-hydroxy acid dehydrogenase YdfG [Natrinema salaciae]